MPTPRLVDLSVPLAEHPGEPVPVVIDRFSHAAGGEHLASLVGIDRAVLPDGLGWASERVSAITHAGTHVDAPFHYSPRCAGRSSRTIDQLPLEWFWGEGVLLDVRTGAGPVTLAELHAFENGAGRPIAAGAIVLFATGAEAFHGSPEYLDRGRAIDPSLIKALTDRGVRVIGTDAWSIDPPIAAMRDRAAREGPASVWSGHFTGRDVEFCAIEKLCNLQQLPATGFTIACFPVKVAGGSAGWSRVVAFLDGGARERADAA